MATSHFYLFVHVVGCGGYVGTVEVATKCQAAACTFVIMFAFLRKNEF